MDARALRKETEGGRRAKQKAERHEGISDMQDQNQPLAKSPIAGPTAKPHQMQQACESERSANQRAVLPDDPDQKHDSGDGHDSNVDATERRGQTARFLAGQPVAREA